MSNLIISVLSLAMFVPAIVLHEVSHGYVSYLLGDPTAKMQKRLSLNPLKHIDPFGTVLLPLLLAATGLPVFGYAKPVPINPHYYKNYRKGMMLTGLAGPTTNLAMAIVASLVVRLLVALGALPAGSSASLSVLGWVLYLFYFFAEINLVLMFFNLIPIPPLDGSRVLPVFLSDRALQSYQRFEQYGLLIFFGAMLILPRVLHVDLIGGYFSITVQPLLHLFTGI